MAGEWDVVDETPVRRKAAQAANGWDVVEEAPVAAVAAPQTTLGESLFARAKAGIASQVGGALQAFGERMSAPLDALQGTVLGDVFAPAAEPFHAVTEAGVSNVELADAYRREAGGVAPESFSAALGDPDNTARYYGGILAESAPAIAAAMLTRNPQVASGIVGATMGAAEYGQARAGGAGQFDALQQAGAAGIIETGLGTLPFEQAMGGGSFLSRLGRTAATEGLTEATTEAGQTALPSMLGDAPLDESAFNRAMFDALVVGSGMGAGEAAIGSVLPAEKAPIGTPVIPPAATAEPRVDTPPTTAIDPTPALGDDAELDALLLRNLPPEVVEAARNLPPEVALGALGDPNPVPVAATPASPATDPRDSAPARDASDLAAAMRMLAQTRAAQSADAPRARTVPPPSQDIAAPAAPTTPAAEDVQASAAERLPAVDADLRPIERDDVLALKSEIGWDEIGGRLIRGGEIGTIDMGASAGRPIGDAVGRTKWVGKPGQNGRESNFWRNRPVKLNEKQAEAALEKWSRGEKLGKRERQFVDYAHDFARGYAEEQEIDRQEAAQYEAWLAEQLPEAQDEDNTAEANEVAGLVERARAAGFDAFDTAPFEFESGEEYATRLRAMLEPRDDDFDRLFGEDAPGDLRRGAESAQAPAAEGFALNAPAKAPAAEEVAPAPAGLFGAPSARDFIDDATRRRDSARNGQGAERTDMLAGEGELFAGRRPEQARVDEPASGSRGNAVDTALADIAAGTHPERALVRADEATIRAVAMRMGMRTNKRQSPASIIERLGEQARAEWMKQARAAMPEPLESQDTTEAVEVSDEELTETERAAFRRQSPTERNALATVRAESARERGESDAGLLRESVRKAVGDSPVRVAYTRGQAGLKGLVNDSFIQQLEDRQRLRGTRMRTSGLYVTGDQSIDGDPLVVLFTDVASTPELAAFTAAHEIAGHHGLRSLLGAELDKALSIAEQNPTVKAVADSMMRRRKMAPAKRLLAVEEALADLAAASRTNDYDTIAERHGVEVPTAQRKTLAGAIARFVERVKALFSRRGMAFTDAQVHDLLADAWRAGQSMDSRGSPEPLESTDAITDAPEFRRWFGDSKVVDAEGKPLVVYHGTDVVIDAFDTRNAPAWFSESAEHAGKYGMHREEQSIYPVYLSLQNPLNLTGKISNSGNRFSSGIDLARRAGISRFMTEDDKFSDFGSPMVEDEHFSIIGSKRFADLVARAGYDGIVIREGKHKTFAAFRPEQIKSATGNNGTFDPDNPNILESVDYTPEQSAALAKAGLPVDRRTTLQRVRDGLREEWHKVRDAARDSDSLKQATFDKFHGLRMAEARVGLTDPAVSPYIAARMSAGLGSTMESLLLYGAPKWRDGVLAIDENTVGLLDALKPVEGSVDEFLGWMVGRRAKLLKSQGREHNLSDADIAALLSLANGRETAFQKAAKEYLKVKTAVLDVAEQAGLIDPEARAAWDHAEYIPFYRAENESVIGPGTRKGLAGQSSGIRTLKGGEQALADPLANIVRNFTRLLDSAGKNRATLLAVDQLGETFFTKAQREFQPATIPLDQVKKHLSEQGVSEQAIAGMPNAALKGVARMLSIVPPTGEDVVRVMRAGKAEYYTVLDPLVLRSLTAFKQANKNLAIKPFIFFKRLLTTGVTTTAEFVGANFLRDSGSAWVISDDRFIPGWDSVRGVVETLRNDQTNREMMMAGGTFLGGQFYGGDPDSAAAALRRALRQKGLSSREIEGFVGTVARTPLHLWDGWLKLSGGVENANRRAVYDAALRAGKTKLEAAYAARDLMDFSMQGDAAWVQFFADVLPFFNARLQGLYKLGRRAGTKEGKRAIVLRGGVIALASVGLMAWNLAMHGDAYDELEEWDKDAYWHIAPGTEYHIRIPKPFEIGIAFATIPERIMAAIQHARTDGEAGDRPKATFDAALRATTGTLAMNPIPQGALPIVEQWANKRFFSGRPIESMGDDKLLPEAREEWFTSDTAKLIADAAGNKTGLSAKRIEHLWNGYTGGLGAYLLDSSDWVVRQATDAPERPEMALRDFPLVGRFARGGNPAPNPKSVGEFYDLLGRAEEIEGTIKEYYARSGNPDMQGEDIGERAFELMEEHRWLLGDTYNSKRLKAGIGFENVRAMRKVRSKLSDLRQDADDVALSQSLSAHEKRVQLDEIAAKRAKLARDMVRKLRASERAD